MRGRRIERLILGVIIALAILALREYRRVSGLRTELRALAGLPEAAKGISQENERLRQAHVDTNEIARLRQEQRLLLRARGQISLLNAALSEPAPKAKSDDGATNSLAQRIWEAERIKSSERADFSIPSRELRWGGNTTPLDALQTALWVVINGDRDSFSALYSGKSKHKPNETTRDNLRRAFEKVSNFHVTHKIEYGSGMINLFFDLDRPGEPFEGQARQGSAWLVTEASGWQIEFLGVSSDPILF